MSVVKLDSTHTELIKKLFTHKKYMGVDNLDSFMVADEGLNQLIYDRFCANYLSDLKNFHAYGYMEDNAITALVSFYESVEEPAWYYTLCRSSGNNQLLKSILDKIISHNESNGRLKFYTVVNQKHIKLLRKFSYSSYNDKRYGYFDECIVPTRCKSYYTNHWELLYHRLLLPEDTIVRCSYLKQEYRTQLPVGGNI